MPIDMSSKKTFFWLVAVSCLGRALYDTVNGTVLGLAAAQFLSIIIFAYLIKWMMPFALAMHRIPVQRDVAVNWVLLFGFASSMVAPALIKMLPE